MRNVTFDEWATLKPTMKFGQIPVFNWDDLELYQSNTIVRFTMLFFMVLYQFNRLTNDDDVWPDTRLQLGRFGAVSI